MVDTRKTESREHKRLAELIQDIRVAMLTTVGENGRPHSRPMYTQRIDPETFDGSVWFFSNRDAVKVDELEKNPAVLVTYACPEKNRYVALYGTATVERDPVRAREVWNVDAQSWFPAGPDDPSLVLLGVEIESAESWDGPTSSSYLFSLFGRSGQIKTEHATMRF